MNFYKDQDAKILQKIGKSVLFCQLKGMEEIRWEQNWKESLDQTLRNP